MPDLSPIIHIWTFSVYHNLVILICLLEEGTGKENYMNFTIIIDIYARNDKTTEKKRRAWNINIISRHVRATWGSLMSPRDPCRRPLPCIPSCPARTPLVSPLTTAPPPPLSLSPLYTPTGANRLLRGRGAQRRAGRGGHAVTTTPLTTPPPPPPRASLPPQPVSAPPHWYAKRVTWRRDAASPPPPPRASVTSGCGGWCHLVRSGRLTGSQEGEGCGEWLPLRGGGAVTSWVLQSDVKYYWLRPAQHRVLVTRNDVWSLPGTLCGVGGLRPHELKYYGGGVWGEWLPWGARHIRCTM